eukprot:4892054-Pleurochrysis_carterae.AAC.1
MRLVKRARGGYHGNAMIPQFLTTRRAEQRCFHAEYVLAAARVGRGGGGEPRSGCGNQSRQRSVGKIVYLHEGHELRRGTNSACKSLP